MFNKKIALISFFIFLSNILLSQQVKKTWTLQDCIQYALENNIQLKQQFLNTTVSKIDYRQSIYNMLPDLNGNATHVYNYGKTVDMYTNQFATSEVRSNNFYLSSNITLFNGFQLLNNMRKSQINYKSAKYDLEKAQNDVALNIATAYIQILYNIELLDISKNQMKVTQQQVERTKKLVEVGSLAIGNLYTIEAQMAQENYQFVNAQNQLDLSYLTLVQMLDLDSIENFTIEKPLIIIQPDSNRLSDPNKIYETALSNQPEIKSAELKVKSSKIGVNIARGMQSPSLSLRGSIGTGYSGASQRYVSSKDNGSQVIGFLNQDQNLPVYTALYKNIYEKTPFNDQIEDNFNKSIGLYLNVPIFNGFQVRNNISKAKIAYKSSQYTFESTKNQLQKTITQAYFDAKAALNKYLASQKTVEAYTEAYKYAEQKFNVGMINTIDYNDAKNKLNKAESDLLQSKYEFMFRVKVLEFYQGKPISLQ